MIPCVLVYFTSLGEHVLVSIVCLSASIVCTLYFPSMPTCMQFFAREALMSRADSLKKAAQSLIDHATDGEPWGTCQPVSHVVSMSPYSCVCMCMYVCTYIRK